MALVHGIIVDNYITGNHVFQKIPLFSTFVSKTNTFTSVSSTCMIKMV